MANLRNRAAGSTKKTVGSMTGNKSMASRGRAQYGVGKLQQAGRNVKKAVKGGTRGGVRKTTKRPTKKTSSFSGTVGKRKVAAKRTVAKRPLGRGVTKRSYVRSSRY